MRLKKLAPLFLALSATLGAARFGIDHIGRIVRLADPQIAPDGKSIALVVSRTNYEEDRYDPELVLVDVATHNQRTLTRDRRGVNQARWSPDGSRLAFLASVLRPLIDSGVVIGAKQKFVIPSRILMKYAAAEYGQVGSGLQKLFADREPFERNIPSILEFRHLQMKGIVDEQIWDHLN